MEQSSEHKTILDTYIGNRLREKRHKMNMTLTDVAQKLGLSAQQIQKYEKAQTRIPATTLFELGEMLGCDASYFFKDFAEFNKKNNNNCTNGNIVIDTHVALNILMIEDDPGDVLLMQRAFNHCSIKVNLLTIQDGVAALEFLRHNSVSIEFPRPDIVLMDLNIPKREGLSVLREIKRDREICDIPVIVITNSINYNEMLQCYKSHASGYICKPFNNETLNTSINTLVHYWAETVILPNRAQG
jgi:CheY-like chemotaxis protein/DNA-binding XRE family transcriptional regulator